MEPTDQSLVNMLRKNGIYEHFCNEMREDIKYLRRQDGERGHKKEINMRKEERRKIQTEI